jgi:hypothetical protein
MARLSAATSARASWSYAVSVATCWVRVVSVVVIGMPPGGSSGGALSECPQSVNRLTSRRKPARRAPPGLFSGFFLQRRWEYAVEVASNVGGRSPWMSGNSENDDRQLWQKATGFIDTQSTGQRWVLAIAGVCLAILVAALLVPYEAESATVSYNTPATTWRQVLRRRAVSGDGRLQGRSIRTSEPNRRRMPIRGSEPSPPVAPVRGDLRYRSRHHLPRGDAQAREVGLN